MNKNKNNFTITISVLIGVLLIALIVIFFSIKNNNTDNNLLENENEKITTANYNVTFIAPKKVFDAIRQDNFLIVDIRSSDDFEGNHIESSINIPLSILTPTNSNLDKNKTLIIIDEEESIDGKEAATKLKDAGFKVSYLQGGLVNYIANNYDLVSFGDITSNQDRAKVNSENLESLGQKLINSEEFIYLDVRSKNDFDKDHFKNAINIPLENLEENKKDIPTGKILVFDEDSRRSFQAAVRLYDMNILSVYYLTNPYSEFKSAIQNQTLLPN